MIRLIANRGLLQIFFALQLVIGIMFIFNYMVYKNSISGIYEKVTENNRMVVKNIIQSFDSSFASINNLMFNIHALPYGQISNSEGKNDMEKVIALQDSLATMVSTLDFVEDAIITYDYNLAITTQGTSSMEALFDRKYTTDKYNSGFWTNFIRSEHDFTVFPAEIYSDINGAHKRNLIVAVDSSKIRMSNKKLMVLIDVNKMLNGIDLKTMMPGASLIVLNENRNVILSTEKDLDLVNILNDVYFNPSSEASLTHKNYEYNFYKSESNGFIYINKLPYQFQNIDSVSNANLWIMYGAIVLAVVLSALLSIYLYRPVKNILQLFGGSNKKGNDFIKIHSGILKVQRENESLKSQMNLVDEEIRRGVFLQTLDGYTHSREYEMQMQNHYAYLFQCRHFVMAAIHLIPQEDAGEETNLSVEQITEMIRSGVQESIDHAVVFHEEHLQFLALIGIEHPSDRKKVLKSFESYIKQTQRDAFASFRVWGCVSRAFESKISNCREGYQDIQNGFLYRNVNTKEWVTDTEAIRFVPDIHFPLQKLEKLSNCLLTGKTDEAMDIVDTIIEENASLRIHHHQMVHIAQTMFFIMLRQANASEENRQELFRIETEFIGKLHDAFNYQEIRALLIDGLRRIAAMRNYDPKSKLNPAFISQYIELHYMENLYLDHMAEVLDTSSKYFSNYFKKTFGVNYVEYLNKVRLSHAREYLKNTDLSIAEIGEKTGYTNSSTFTTTFKKYCGVSPSEYRKKTAN
ncbi:AraC family transcriptional regulator [Paenibacillus sp. N3/727]|uniref:helix-turn-helix domain-containing protein n=1 Tax=Paenibacillus sp. N3/727 TaxID=2925845 RepID=UPI001F53108D|nr:AraC family transcriptional regulator [Paenibacillus sp. N3/727]UNK18938.1 AraC family transcriptional regulator [Paenibacillus sp. N3/727]